jgi:serine/threonine protein kinase
MAEDVLDPAETRRAGLLDLIRTLNPARGSLSSDTRFPGAAHCAGLDQPTELDLRAASDQPAEMDPPAMPEPHAAPEPPAYLGGRYRLLERIGVGSMATVHRARDEFLGRDVAVKLVRTLSTSEDERRRDDAEVKVLARLNHHNLVTLLDAGSVEDSTSASSVYLVMELVNGQDLRHRLLEGPLTLLEAAQVGHDLAEGLDYVHVNGVVHRDIKPANVMLYDYPNDPTRVRAKLADFGIAFIAESPLTQENTISGTAAYLSPEQVKAEPLGPASDIYSLGLVLLQCLTGELAYPGPMVESALARLNQPPHIPRDLDQRWQDLLINMTDTDPAVRPTARQVAEALTELEISSSTAANPDLIPPYEDRRMEAVKKYCLLDTPPDGAYDNVTAVAARLFSTPIAIISVVDSDRIWFKSHHGLDIDQINRDPGLCASAILHNAPWVITDAQLDPRTLTNPLVAGEFGLRFYAGVPLRTRDGYNLGTLCVLDFESRPFTAEDTRALEGLAALVMNDLELRRTLRESAAQARA